MKRYLKLARFDHYVKNLFIVPGFIFNFISSLSPENSFNKFSQIGELLDRIAVVNFFALALSLASICLVSSANYTLNEYLDRFDDANHPDKRSREAVKGGLNPFVVYFCYLLFALLGVLVSLLVNVIVFWLSLSLLIMGIIYNVKPFRAKDRAYIDVVIESINNPLRLAIGWYSYSTNNIVPSSLLLSFFFGGVFLMSLKRYVEFNVLGLKVAGKYRKSFKKWKSQQLLSFAFGSSITSAFFLGIFLIRVKPELIVSFPSLVFLFTRYFVISLNLNVVGYKPEKLFREQTLILLTASFFFSIILGLLITTSFFAV
jgi:decaprenyl-phosphate phosphoribosyltransferase